MENQTLVAVSHFRQSIKRGGSVSAWQPEKELLTQEGEGEEDGDLHPEV